MRGLLAGSREREGVPQGVVGLRTTVTIGDPVMDGNTNPYTEPNNLDSFPGTVRGISLHCQEGYTVRLAANRGVSRQEGYPFLRAGTPGRRPDTAPSPPSPCCCSRRSAMQSALPESVGSGA